MTKAPRTLPEQIPNIDDVRAGRAIIRTPRGVYMAAEVAEKLKKAAKPDDPWSSPYALFGVPIYVVPPARKAPWRVRAWRRLRKAAGR